MLPDYIDPDLWADWLSVREKKKAVNSERALKAQLKRLERIHNRGGNPNEALITSIAREWTSIYEPKSTRGSVTAAARAYTHSILERG